MMARKQEIHFTIPVEPKTKKNHQTISVNPKTGKYFVTPSSQYKKYKLDVGYFLRGKGNKIDYPVNIQAIYYVGTRRKVDIANLNSCLHDVLVDYEVLEDDNARIIVSTDGSRVRYDKDNPRTEVTITPASEEDILEAEKLSPRRRT